MVPLRLFLADDHEMVTVWIEKTLLESAGSGWSVVLEQEY